AVWSRAADVTRAATRTEKNRRVGGERAVRMWAWWLMSTGRLQSPRITSAGTNPRTTPDSPEGSPTLPFSTSDVSRRELGAACPDAGLSWRRPRLTQCSHIEPGDGSQVPRGALAPRPS